MNAVPLRPFLPALLVVALFAGCVAEPPDDATKTAPEAPGESPEQPSTDAGEVKTRLEQAVLDMPQRFGVDMRVEREGQLMVGLSGFLDNASQTSHFTMRMDPNLFPPEEMGVLRPMRDLFLAGFEAYLSPEGSVFVFNGSAMVVPPGEETPFSSQDNPLAQFLELSRPSVDEEGTAEFPSVTPTVWNGRGALDIQVRETNRTTGLVSDGRAVLYLSPLRLAHVEAHVPAGTLDEAGEPDPLAGASVVVDFRYEDEIPADPPLRHLRALGLAHDVEARGFDARDPEAAYEITWTFRASGGVPLESVALVVKDPSTADPTRLGSIPADAWRMRFSQLQADAGPFRAAYEDLDGDGLVSAGDRLHLSLPSRYAPAYVTLQDEETGLLLVPGPGALLLPALLGSALVLRRK